MSDHIKRRATIVPQWSKPPSQSPPNPHSPVNLKAKKKANAGTVSRRFSVYNKKPTGTANQYNFSPSSNLPPLPTHLGYSEANNIVRHDTLEVGATADKKNQIPVGTAGILVDSSVGGGISTFEDHRLNKRQNLLDINALSKELNVPDYDAALYLKNTLANANSDNLAVFNSNIDQLKAKNEIDVQTSINQSFNQVLTLSDSITQTKDYLEDLKVKLNQLNLNLTSQVKGSGGVSDVASIVSGNGSHSSQDWVQLNHSMKELRLVNVFIERDTLSLKTSKSKGNGDEKTVESLTIGNVVVNVIKNDTYKNEFVVNLKTGSGGSIVNGDGGSSIVLKTDKQAEFNQLIQVVNNIKKKMNNRNSTNSLLMNSKSVTVFKDIDDMLTNIEISMGGRKFVDSVYWVKKIELKFKDLSANYQLEKNMTPQEQESFHLKINLKSNNLKKLRNNLINTLTHQLTNYINWSNQKKIAEMVDCFTVLGLQDTARSIYLNLQSSKLKNLVSNLHFEVDLVNYVNQLSLIFSNVMLKTIEEYNSLFIINPDNQVEKANSKTKELLDKQNYSKVFILEWVNSQIENFNKLFKNQLMDLKKDDEIYLTCAGLTMEQFTKLDKVGANVDYLLRLI